jgi:hypothetical protein
VLAQRGFERLAQQAIHRLGAHLLTEALLDHLGRHLARAETLDARSASDLTQTSIDVGLQALLRQGEGQAAFQVAGGFDRSLHVDSCHRWRMGPGSIGRETDLNGARIHASPVVSLILAGASSPLQDRSTETGAGKMGPAISKDGAKGGTRTPTPCGTGT